MPAVPLADCAAASGTMRQSSRTPAAVIAFERIANLLRSTAGCRIHGPERSPARAIASGSRARVNRAANRNMLGAPFRPRGALWAGAQSLAPTFEGGHMIELHSSPTPNGQKVMIMLEETGL